MIFWSRIIEMDNGAIIRNKREKECDDISKEGAATIVSELDDTDISQV